jgi:hypothetical protein
MYAAAAAVRSSFVRYFRKEIFQAYRHSAPGHSLPGINCEKIVAHLFRFVLNFRVISCHASQARKLLVSSAQRVTFIEDSRHLSLHNRYIVLFKFGLGFKVKHPDRSILLLWLTRFRRTKFRIKQQLIAKASPFSHAQLLLFAFVPVQWDIFWTSTRVSFCSIQWLGSLWLARRSIRAKMFLRPSR